MDMWSASQRRYSRGSRLPGSARVTRVGERVLAVANFSQHHAIPQNLVSTQIVSARLRTNCETMLPKSAQSAVAPTRCAHFNEGIWLTAQVRDKTKSRHAVKRNG